MLHTGVGPMANLQADRSAPNRVLHRIVPVGACPSGCDFSFCQIPKHFYALVDRCLQTRMASPAAQLKQEFRHANV